MINNNDAIKMARALVELGYDRIATPASESSVEIQCKWCLRSVKEPQCSRAISTIKFRIKHDEACPVALAQSI